ncbi:hypothetical protein M0R45_018977 [Rubus argutus]|uniref:Protein kinase domain-containing protein n=1 Tax=Rubus argutus TaxID=59490 RepID=A0AAW1X7S7_RUBAR
MKYIRTNSLKRLFSLKRRSLEEISSPTSGCCNVEESNESLKSVEAIELSPRPTWKCFSFEEISDATNGFSSENLVGKGGYAEVYRGVIRGNEEIAVKRITKAATDERKEKEFLNEIGTIGHVCHPNVLSLVGCCIDNGLYLIFHFSSRGSVASLLHDENLPPMDWKTRYKIAIGTARGLHYLHKGCQRRIIHRDIKSTNILLTADFEPQISDFGLAKWLPSQWTHHSIAPIEGTFGHLAPEKPVDGSHQSLHSWAKPILNQGEIDQLVDPRLRGVYDVTQLKRLAFAGSLCIRASPTWRPTMSEVLEVMELEGEIDEVRWKMPEKEEEEHDEFWGFEDLEYEFDSSFSVSPHDSISTKSY